MPFQLHLLNVGFLNKFAWDRVLVHWVHPCLMQICSRNPTHLTEHGFMFNHWKEKHLTTSCHVKRQRQQLITWSVEDSLISDMWNPQFATPLPSTSPSSSSDTHTRSVAAAKSRNKACSPPSKGKLNTYKEKETFRQWRNNFYARFSLCITQHCLKTISAQTRDMKTQRKTMILARILHHKPSDTDIPPGTDINSPHGRRSLSADERIAGDGRSWSWTRQIQYMVNNLAYLSTSMNDARWFKERCSPSSGLQGRQQLKSFHILSFSYWSWWAVYMVISEPITQEFLHEVRLILILHVSYNRLGLAQISPYLNFLDKLCN